MLFVQRCARLAFGQMGFQYLRFSLQLLCADVAADSFGGVNQTFRRFLVSKSDGMGQFFQGVFLPCGEFFQQGKVGFGVA